MAYIFCFIYQYIYLNFLSAETITAYDSWNSGLYFDDNFQDMRHVPNSLRTSGFNDSTG